MESSEEGTCEKGRRGKGLKRNKSIKEQGEG